MREEILIKQPVLSEGNEMKYEFARHQTPEAFNGRYMFSCMYGSRWGDYTTN